MSGPLILNSFLWQTKEKENNQLFYEIGQLFLSANDCETRVRFLVF